MMGSIVYLFVGRPSNSIAYSLKVWITSVILPPVMFLIADILTNKNHLSLDNYILDDFPYLIAIVILGGVFSFITWVVFVLVINLIISRCTSFRQIKHLIALAGALLTVSTFAVFDLDTFNIKEGFFHLMLIYTACIIGSSYCYKLKIKINQV